MAETGKENSVAKKSGGFIKGLRSEFSKIVWPDTETIGKETVVVVVISIALGIIIAILDLIIKFGLSFIL